MEFFFRNYKNILTADLFGTTIKSSGATMIYEWDEAKRKANIAAHDVDFSAAAKFEWDSALLEMDDREDYGELREQATGFIGPGLFVLVFTRRDQDDDEVIRIISLRKAARKEIRRYVEKAER
jgi:uncharacterized DUF497 family protein